MLSKPLNLASHLRRPSASMDWMFYVNAVVLVVFFLLFGSRFILSPALMVAGAEFQPVSVPGSTVNYVESQYVVSVMANGQSFTMDKGYMSFEQLNVWLIAKAQKTPGASLLVLLDERVPYLEWSKVHAAAISAGFGTVSLATDPNKAGPGTR